MNSSNLARTLTQRPLKAFGQWNMFSALLLLPEQGPARLIQRILEGYGMQVHCATGAMEAAQFMRGRRIDLAIVDCDLPWASELNFLEPATHWRGVSMVLSPRTRNYFRGKRVHFILPKPVSADLFSRGLKAAYTNMAQQRIATFRHAVPARVVSGTISHRGWQRTLHQVNVLNVSQTGLCLNAAEPLPHGATLAMNLVFPQNSSALHASGKIVWSHSNGRTGVAFERSSCPEMKKLQEQLKAWLPPELGMVARIF